MSGLFGGLFDFNRDGKTDIFETALFKVFLDSCANSVLCSARYKNQYNVYKS